MPSCWDTRKPTQPPTWGGGGAANKIAILASLAFDGAVPRAGIATEGIDRFDARDTVYAA